ncbi:hypothetical protein [Streptomyces sp. NPDC101455]
MSLREHGPHTALSVPHSVKTRLAWENRKLDPSAAADPFADFL